MWHPESIFDASGHLDEGVVHAWLDGQLAPDAATRVEQHAAACAACSTMVAEARGLIAGASRVLSSLDEPAVGKAPARGAPIGIVAAAGAASAIGTAAPAPNRWSTRRISLAAAAALVFVAGTLVLRDGGSVKEMVQADQLALDSAVGVAETAAQEQPGGPVLGSGVSGESVTGSAQDAASAAIAAKPLDLANSSPAARASDESVSRALVGSTRGASGTARIESGFAAPPVVSSRPTAPPAAPAPASPSVPSQARPRSSEGAPSPQVAGGIARGLPRNDAERAGKMALDPSVLTGAVVTTSAGVSTRDVAAPAAATRSAASPDVTAQAADARRTREAQTGVTLLSEATVGAVRSSGEIQAMVRMMSSCWRIAGSDSVLELLPPGSSRASFAAPEGSNEWIQGWLRIGRDATNPDRIWWLPLGDSVSVRVRASSETEADLVITPRPGRALLRRVPRAETLTAGDREQEAVPGTAESVRCPSP